MSQLSDLLFETRVATESVVDFLAGGRLRLGVTGLSRSGKTVFITALVHHLTRAISARPEKGGETKTQLPVFRALEPAAGSVSDAGRS
ncbi:MAG: YcjX family protein, partial [Methylocystis sp.]|nr:YcjX family protein [Methylocystis sp.]